MGAYGRTGQTGIRGSISGHWLTAKALFLLQRTVYGGGTTLCRPGWSGQRCPSTSCAVTVDLIKLMSVLEAPILSSHTKEEMLLPIHQSLSLLKGPLHFSALKEPGLSILLPSHTTRMENDGTRDDGVHAIQSAAACKARNELGVAGPRL